MSYWDVAGIKVAFSRRDQQQKDIKTNSSLFEIVNILYDALFYCIDQYLRIYYLTYWPVV